MFRSVTIRRPRVKTRAVPEPRVSVICIFFNEERFLAEAVDSVLTQDFEDFELLLVDDGSSDGSTAIANSYVARDPDRIRYLTHPGGENRGMSATRNLGLRHARGEFVAMIDGDDCWTPDKLSQQVAILDANADAGMVCGAYIDWRSWSGGQDRICAPGPVAEGITFPPETTLAVYPLGRAQSGTNALVRRAVVEKVGGYEDEFTGFYEDQVFLAKLFLETGAYWSPQVWFRYRRHPASCTLGVDGPQYGAMKTRFLDWFERYLAERDIIGRPAIEQAVGRARWELRHRHLARGRRRVRGLRSRLAAVIGRRR